MTWLVELPNQQGTPFLLNIDNGPIVVEGNDTASTIGTPLGSFTVGLSYAALCDRLRLNAADRMPVIVNAAPTPLPDQQHAAVPVLRRALGRRPAKRDERVPRLRDVAPGLPPAPATFSDYVQVVRKWILGRNDTIGDCTCVGPANVILALTTLAGDERRLSDDQIVSFYEQVGHYDPADPSSDQGAMIEDVLAAWHVSGLAADKLDGYATIEPGDHDRIKQAIALLGPVDVGLDLPNGWLQASEWDVSTAGTGIAGGHCVIAVGYDDDGLQIVSWGSVFTLSWAGWDYAVDEAHALVSRDALTKAGKDAGGVDWAALQGFMAIIRGAA